MSGTIFWNGMVKEIDHYIADNDPNTQVHKLKPYDEVVRMLLEDYFQISFDENPHQKLTQKGRSK